MEIPEKYKGIEIISIHQQEDGRYYAASHETQEKLSSSLEGRKNIGDREVCVLNGVKADMGKVYNFAKNLDPKTHIEEKDIQLEEILGE